MCLKDHAGVSAFLNEVKAIASEEGMTFVDRSAGSQHELEDLNYAGVEGSRGKQVVNVSAARSDGLSMGATNLGLSEYQVVVGISGRRNNAASLKFANRALARFGQHWRIVKIPAGRGALPMSDCD
jgi:hypothetical protein